MDNKFDIIVIGAGHAGIEAAFAASKFKLNVALLTMDLKKIGVPSCNPSIGGTAKGHIVKEIDALGGAMGYLADRAGIHFKMLNKSKGPAVWSPRAQIDKYLYPKYALELLNNDQYITLIKSTAYEIITENSKVIGVKDTEDNIFYAEAVVFCPGTFLNGKMFTGEVISYGGRRGEKPSEHISNQIANFGFDMKRLKTGTPPRIERNSINFNNIEIAKGDDNPTPFSYRTKQVNNSVVCWQTATNLHTHEILRTGFDKSPMFTGVIKGRGPRYCPSIEDKISRFAERDSHKIVLEPEGLNTNSVYVNGYSTSLPMDVQEKGLKSIKGLENVKMLLPGYAIEYDYFPSYQLYYTLETRIIGGLYLAGQVNGSSGYEEAAAQGLMAGINAALKIVGKDEFILGRNESYIGVMIDDLVNKSSDEPYRLFTSLAEYRLLLRQDNADIRLTQKGHDIGLIDDEQYEKYLNKKENIRNLIDTIRNHKPDKDTVNKFLAEHNESPLEMKIEYSNILKRSNVKLHDLYNEIIKNDQNIDNLEDYPDEIMDYVQNEIKYEGYIKRQLEEVKYFIENENKKIPEKINYDDIISLSKEAREKLKKVRPKSLGQASRIPGVSATDLSIISVYIK